MMICKADFEDLFPDLFPPEAEPAEHPDAAAANPADEALAAQQSVDPGLHYGWPGVMIASAIAASKPLTAANEAVWKSLPALGNG
ncbi:hypothetical protein ACG74X_14230 [Marivita sp. S0852]|uniref:hypothetical protein n=1 Tax=Marivita sp. S0852 TaxID=3373893 RepID=UPI003981CC9F